MLVFEQHVAWCLQVLYESPYDAQFIIVSDSWKRSVGYSDAFPESLKLGKGAFTVRLQVRHDSSDALDSLKGLPLVLKRRLASEVRCFSIMRHCTL